MDIHTDKGRISLDIDPATLPLVDPAKVAAALREKQSAPDPLPMIDVTAQPHPLLSGLEVARVPQGSTLRELGAGEFVRAFVDGDVCEDFDYVPLAGQSVVLKAMVAGGEGGKNALRLVATIAVITASSFVAGPAGLGLGPLAGAAVTVGGQLAINALIPPPSQQLDTPNGFEPFRGAPANQNTLNPFGVIPRLYGTHKMYPPLAARPFTEQAGKEQYLRMLFCLGYGPLTIDEASFKLGDTLLSEYEVEYEIREGTDNDEPITLFSRNVAETSLADNFDEDDKTVIRTSPNVSLNGSGKGLVTLDFVAPALLHFIKNKNDYVATGFKIEYKRAADSDWTLLKPVAQGGAATLSPSSEGGYSDHFPFNQANDNTVLPNTDNAADEGAYEGRGPAFFVMGAETRPYGLSISVEVDHQTAYDFRVTRKWYVPSFVDT